MNPFFSKIIINAAKKRLEAKHPKRPITNAEITPLANNIEVEWTHAIKEFIYVVVGVASAGFGLRGFLLPNNFIDGGATGISLLLQNVTPLSLGVLLILVNLPFLILATKTISTQFALKSLAAILVLALVVHFVDYPLVTDDKLLISIFGGFFLGLGIGLAMRGAV